MDTKKQSQGVNGEDKEETTLYCIQQCKFERKDKKGSKTIDMIPCSLCHIKHHHDCDELKKRRKSQNKALPGCSDIYITIATLKNTAKINDDLSKTLTDTNTSLRHPKKQANFDRDKKEKKYASLRLELSV